MADAALLHLHSTAWRRHTNAHTACMVPWAPDARHFARLPTPHPPTPTLPQTPQAVAFSPDGSILASADTSHTVRLWDMASPSSPSRGGPKGGGGGGGPRQRAVLEAEASGQLTAMSFSPSGALLATGSASGELHVFDTAGGGVSSVRAAHAGAIRRLAFSPNSKALVSASDDCTLRLWDPQMAAASGRGASGAGQGGQPAGVAGAFSAHFTRAGRVMACLSEDGGLTMWDAGAAAAMAAPQRAQGTSRPCASRVSPDGATLAVGEADGIIRLWDLGSGKLRARLKGHGDAVRDLAFSPAGDALASASEDCRARLWSVSSGQQLALLTGHTSAAMSVAVSPDAGMVAAGAEDGTIRGWPTAAAAGPSAGKASLLLKGHSGPVLRLAFSPDSRLLASGSADHTVRLWDATASPGGAALAVLHGHREAVRRLSWGAGGRLLASASRGVGASGVVCIYDANTGEQLYSVHASDMVEPDASCPGTLCTIVSTIEHAPHLTLVSEGRPAAGGAPQPQPGAAAGGRLQLRQVPVYTSFAAPACIAVHSASMVMAFGSAVNFYKY